MDEADFWLTFGSETCALNPLPRSDVVKVNLPKVRPLDAQFGVWPRKNLPESVSEYLFEDSIVENSETLRQTFAILDAAKTSALPSMLQESGLANVSLFNGKAAEDLAEVAPYLVQLDVNNDFVRRLFTDTDSRVGLWRCQLGIFIKSDATLEKLQRVFRKFTRVRDQEGKWSFFRFWEPEVASVHFEYLLRHSELAQRWFHTADGHSINYTIFLLDGCAAQYSMKKSTSPDVSPPFQLQNAEKQAFKARRMEKSLELIRHRLARLFPDKSTSQIHDTVQMITARFVPYGFRNTGSLFALSWFELQHGPNFDQKMPLKMLRDLREVNTPEDLRIAKIRACLNF
ncbi:DUF4123 domain-containing protein [Thioclava litoralis]|uniref:DUF4123 domain-containing protein n=1 Tax=Thioclava litoralis TaxID=3076557 RepID=A0ABZ1E364_9RHOB|nr:DUF4123 domain-containing protein [Thioclava sp. FTW29]